MKTIANWINFPTALTMVVFILSIINLFYLRSYRRYLSLIITDSLTVGIPSIIKSEMYKNWAKPPSPNHSPNLFKTLPIPSHKLTNSMLPPLTTTLNHPARPLSLSLSLNLFKICSFFLLLYVYSSSLLSQEHATGDFTLCHYRWLLELQRWGVLNFFQFILFFSCKNCLSRVFFFFSVFLLIPFFRFLQLVMLFFLVF